MSITAAQAVGATTYPGRGILAGRSADGKKAVMAYFIMGRSVNSRNRVFVEQPGGIRTEAFDPSKMVDPSLIIYSPVRTLGNRVIVTNGDQTDTVYDTVASGGTFADALRTRTFEPDAPNFTPRVSAMLTFADGSFRLDMSILRAGDPEGGSTTRVFWEYDAIPAGEARFLHTYLGDGSPIPSFRGDPETVVLGNAGAAAFAEELWNALDRDNRVSLWVRVRDLATGADETKIINANA